MKTHRETECALLYIFRRIGLAVQVKLKVASSLYLYAEPKVGIRTDTYDGSEQGRPDRVASMVGGLLYRFKMPTFQ